MVTYLINVSIVFGLLFGILVCPYKLAKGVLDLDHGHNRKRTVLDILKCSMPVVNIFVAEKGYKDKIVLGLFGTLAWLAALGRIAMIFLMPTDVKAQYISLVVMLVLMGIYWVMMIIFVMEILRDSGIIGGMGMIIMSVIFPIGQYYIGTYLAKGIEYDKNREDIFKWEN